MRVSAKTIIRLLGCNLHLHLHSIVVVVLDAAVAVAATALTEVKRRCIINNIYY